MTRPRILAALALVLATAPALAEAPPFPVVATVEGPARVVDGDTLFVASVEVRLQGVAAPEHGRRTEPGGPEATAPLRSWAEGRTVRCLLDGTTTWGREVGACYVEGAELGAALIRAGLARDCPRYSRGRYAAAERAARAEGRDLSRVYALPGYCGGR